MVLRGPAQAFGEANEPLGSGGSIVSRPKLKGIDGRSQQEWNLRLNLTTRGNSLGPNTLRIDRSKTFHNRVNGGAWPLLVRGLARLVNSVNERDPFF